MKNSLKQPEIIRLDSEERLSPDLENFFYFVKEHEKEGNLLYILLNKITEEEQTIIFCATRQEVEYLAALLKAYNIQSSQVYGKADQQQREMNLKMFRKQETHVLLVTDVAARGVDIPELDNVINYDFPPTAKLYIHRCGRVARAGRLGKCFNLIQTDEIGYLMDLQVFALEEKEIQHWLPNITEQNMFNVVVTLSNRLADWAQLNQIANTEKIDLGTKNINGNVVTLQLPTSVRGAFTIAVRGLGWKYSDKDGVLHIWK